ncbi:MmcQ/YjbR family DNA-binding protein [Actinomyces bowdenii]|uniref:MmcQ/YjbR family DNA-binding protein n=1 Tax=Actinomyces bowdenii TaxID=131109 RepID=UPI00214B6EB1|nr:MmcQ/YjbR family DNA-binding protein [Actinomyces bowdenii]MCR2052873.1 MmcQ/YjbR family DNA-binding protein [Actinomyces bowdenii]
MGHLPHFPPDHPDIERVRRIALALPEAKEKLSVGRPAFYTKKVFVWFGMSRKVDGVWDRSPISVCVLLPEDERQAVLGSPAAYIPGYIGPYGWVGLLLDESTDWVEIAELIEESYRMTAPARLVRMLDGGA